MQRKVQVKRNALPEILHHINILNSNNDVAIREMSTIFRNMMTILQKENDVDMNNDGTTFIEHVKDGLTNEKDGIQNHLPVPVYFYTKPTMIVQFILHAMLSMGRFATEIYLIKHNAIRDLLRYVKLIIPSDYPENLE